MKDTQQEEVDAPEPVGPLPWQLAAWQRLLERLDAGRMPHALLIAGVRGLGKGHFARSFAQTALCEARRGETACGECRSCRLAAAESHPDLLQVHPDPEKPQGPITVDQARALGERLALMGQYGSRRVAVLEPADRLNVNAANALLKTLEEPAEGTLLILVTERPSELPATIRSRCQQLTLAPPERAEGRAWLQQRLSGADDPDTLLALAGDAPLAALRLAREGGLESRQTLFADLEAVAAGRGDPVAVAGRWLQYDAGEVLDRLHGWLGDMIRLRCAGEAAPLREPDLGERLHRIAGGVDLTTLFDRLGRVESARRLAGGPANTQLLLEDILIGCATDRQNSQSGRRETTS